MEEQQEFVIPKAPFPAPPPFWKHFTTTNLERLKELESTESAQPTQPTQLPLELTYLRPPPPPATTLESYTTFSQPQPLDTTPPLPPAEVLLFDPSKPINHAVLLTRFTKSLLLNFLELMTVLSADPTAHAEKMEDIRRLTLNVHALINMYRPHQARESVKEMLEEMLEDGRREIEECERVKGKVHEFLESVGEAGKEADEGGDVEIDVVNDSGLAGGLHNESGKVEDEKLAEARRLWKMVHEIGNE